MSKLIILAFMALSAYSQTLKCTKLIDLDNGEIANVMSTVTTTKSTSVVTILGVGTIKYQHYLNADGMSIYTNTHSFIVIDPKDLSTVLLDDSMALGGCK